MPLDVFRSRHWDHLHPWFQLDLVSLLGLLAPGVRLTTIADNRSSISKYQTSSIRSCVPVTLESSSPTISEDGDSDHKPLVDYVMPQKFQLKDTSEHTKVQVSDSYGIGAFQVGESVQVVLSLCT